MEDEDEEGSGFFASLMDGSSVDLIKMAGLELSDYDRDRLWDKTDWQDLVVDAGAELVEKGNFDEYPRTSDVFYWVKVPDAPTFTRALRDVIVKTLSG